MPKVTRSRPPKKATRVKSPSVKSAASRIKPVGELVTGIRLLLYGRGKTGKTRLACTFPKPVLVMGCAGYGTEQGTESVKNVKGVDFVDIQKTEEIAELVQIPRYKTLVLDTAGGLQERVVNEYTGHEASVRKDWRHVNKGDWGPINSKTMERIQSVLAVSDDGRNSVIVAHEREFNVDSESELLSPFVGAALTPGVAAWLDGAVHYIGQCFIREGYKHQQVKIGTKGKTKVKKVSTGKMEYCLRVGPHPVYKTGFRVPVGQVLPDVIVDPCYEKIRELIEGK